MLLIRVARMMTTWTKTEHRDPKQREPIFREGDRVVSHVRFDDGVATLPEAVMADVLLEESGALQAFQFQPRAVERSWALFGLRMGDGDEMELWLRDGRGFFYGAPRRAEYRLALLRPGEVTRVIHNAKNDFSASSGRERTYRWNDFVIEPLGRVREVRVGAVVDERVIPLERAKTVDLREDLL
jgi:hypothetical protein